MINYNRKLGMNIFILMNEKGITYEKLANELNDSYKDVHKMIEGRLMLQPNEIEKIAKLFNISKKDLLNYESDTFIHSLQYIKNFNNLENLDKILNILDDYIEIKEILL